MRPIVKMPEENRATYIGNMHKKFGKDRAHVWFQRYPRGQTDTQTYSSQYCTAAPAGEVIRTTPASESCKYTMLHWPGDVTMTI